MPKFRKKYSPRHEKRKIRTGEDIDMLRERSSPNQGEASTRYKDHIDGA
ncbi:MAG: hypothetical protein IJU64_02750 [Bacilli bacterium]|nr:hypothetical protein [Bacilli bacterium]